MLIHDWLLVQRWTTFVCIIVYSALYGDAIWTDMDTKNIMLCAKTGVLAFTIPPVRFCCASNHCPRLRIGRVSHIVSLGVQHTLCFRSRPNYSYFEDWAQSDYLRWIWLRNIRHMCSLLVVLVVRNKYHAWSINSRWRTARSNIIQSTYRAELTSLQETSKDGRIPSFVMSRPNK